MLSGVQGEDLMSLDFQLHILAEGAAKYLGHLKAI